MQVDCAAVYEESGVNMVVLKFPGVSANESFARGAVASLAIVMDPTMEELEDIKTAVSEAVTNCIVHAYPDRVGEICMEMRVLPDGEFEVTVEDKGCGIADVKQARRPMFTTGGSERTGMGFTIMESFMSRMTVESTPGEGTKVVMARRIAGRRETEA